MKILPAYCPEFFYSLVKVLKAIKAAANGRGGKLSAVKERKKSPMTCRSAAIQIERSALRSSKTGFGFSRIARGWLAFVDWGARSLLYMLQNAKEKSVCFGWMKRGSLSGAFSHCLGIKVGGCGFCRLYR